MAAEPDRCTCCGVTASADRCLLCGGCDGRHGAALQDHLQAGVARGELDPGLALARALIDDASVTGRIVLTAGPGGALITIPEPPPRWLVAAARAVARGELPDLRALCDAVLGRYIPGRCSPAVLEAIARELADALRFVDPDVLDVRVTSARDALDPHHLLIEVIARTPTIGAVLGPGGETAAAAIPADIMHRPRGQA